MKQFELDKMTTNDLENLIEVIHDELHRRRASHWKELVQDVCDAMNKLYEAFPYTELNIGYFCEGCGTDEEIDVLHELCDCRTLTVEDFDRWD